MRVAIPDGYPAPFCFDLGQRGVELERVRFVRGSGVVPWLDAVTFASGAGFDLLHTLNAVPIRSATPYVVTFESYLPRVPDDRPLPGFERWLMGKLLAPQCRAVIAFSEFAMRQLKLQVARNPGSEALLDKAEVLYPAAPLHAQSPKASPSDSLRLLFVGRDFARKGGPALVRAHQALVARGVPVQTTVVSSLGWQRKGVVGPSSSEVMAAEHARLASCGIEHLTTCPNDEVLQRMAEADFLVLPTVNDTFGFVTLEAMSLGTPVIGTSTYALPEIVEHGVDGFLLDMPNDPDVGRWTGLAHRTSAGYDDLYLALMDDLGRQMADRLEQFWAGRGSYEAMSAAALAKMRERFDPTAARDRLEQVYLLGDQGSGIGNRKAS